MAEDLELFYERLKKEAGERGYHLNPDIEFTKELLAGLLRNKERYGYIACPCRLASGVKEEDADIVCPCDYRDPDLDEFGMCYCALYVSGPMLRGEKNIASIPDRRPPEGAITPEPLRGGIVGTLPLPVYRCKVCGYLCAREHPPEVCPICRVPKERFERFI